MLVAEKVRAFYERHPYPPPVDSLESYRLLWHDRQRRRADFHLAWPARSYREDQSILIAGCGTSQAAKHALRWPMARVTGVDFSATSVHHTEALKRKYDLRNLTVRQLAVEDVCELGATFDQIVCTGVLHHLADPAAGLAALRDVLRPDGALHLMVYAPHGRIGVYMLQEFCRRVGIAATDDGIRELVAALGALPPGHPLGTLLREAPDFRKPAALADALLHPQDRAYSVPQLFELLHGAGLQFGRWVRQAPYSPRCGVMARLPQAARLAALPLPDQYAAVELFRGTMLRHSAILYRDDAEAATAGTASLHRRRLGKLRADPHARHHRRRGEPARRRGRGAHQPQPHLHGHLPADRRAGEAALRRDRRHADDPRHRADGRGARRFTRPVRAALLVRPDRLRGARARRPSTPH